MADEHKITQADGHDHQKILERPCRPTIRKCLPMAASAKTPSINACERQFTIQTAALGKFTGEFSESFMLGDGLSGLRTHLMNFRRFVVLQNIL
ncbi:MAG TPA: hypothetical protein VFF11_14665 [Candidatus Binatia bacterium]|nr:hypothetical protein [Candidatus Binatia bacterium]